MSASPSVAVPTQGRPYLDFLRYARQLSKRADEAEDLLQTILLAAVEAGRADLTCTDNRRWLIGALRKRALFDARSLVRRRQRETAVSGAQASPDESQTLPRSFVKTLPPSLRTTALLALTGHSKAEISWLLDVSDAALRQRIAEIRRRWRALDGRDFSEFPGLKGALAFGQIRQALLKPVRSGSALLASHDPDGNIFVLSSQNRGARQQHGNPKITKE